MTEEEILWAKRHNDNRKSSTRGIERDKVGVVGAVAAPTVASVVKVMAAERIMKVTEGLSRIEVTPKYAI